MLLDRRIKLVDPVVHHHHQVEVHCPMLVAVRHPTLTLATVFFQPDLQDHPIRIHRVVDQPHPHLHPMLQVQRQPRHQLHRSLVDDEQFNERVIAVELHQPNVNHNCILHFNRIESIV